MNTEEFNKVYAAQMLLCDAVLIEKAKEYATDKDRLHNFKIAAALQECTVRDAIGRMMSKHTVSIYDMVKDPHSFPLAQWNQKITDHINYLILLKADLVEESFDELEETDSEPSFKSNVTFKNCDQLSIHERETNR